jgi:hypothetical protein
MDMSLSNFRPATQFRSLISILALAIAGLTPTLGWTRDFVFHSPNTESLQSLRVQNQSHEPQPAWLVFYDDEYLEEFYFEIPARGLKTLSIPDLKQPHWSFAVVTKTSLVRPLADRGPWEFDLGTRYEMRIQNQSTIDFQVLNLLPEKQKILFRYLNANGEVIQEKTVITLGFHRTLFLSEVPPLRASKLVIESETPVQMTASAPLKPLLDQRRPALANATYFLVETGPGGTNFVAPLTDPALITQARQEILNPQGLIVFADVSVDPTQPNRHFSSSGKNFWSWSIRKVTGLAQIGADWCHGYPEMIERMMAGFLRQQHVCFRGQRIIRELKARELESGVLSP